ncbi:hypothetical protein LOD99_13754 [Oopsacas minuta]|uniref:TOM1-like protein 2 n=1 Tax=Oopsacas minuta TaxID=111878 RepID=A0AAV7KI32_9METZ|nr:hypothetical protein LOD99_13754 [Oopsacas minuta]
MTSVFKNPLSTPVGQRLNTAVSHGQSSIDYPLVMEMCDIINDTDNGPKEAKAAFKKILFSSKDTGLVLQCLAILDMCIKNGQKRFHRHIITKDFVLEIAKLAQTGKSTHNAVREKSLLLIQSWADTYRGKEDMGVAAEIYDQLKSNGVEFPAVNLDDMVPVRTPPSRQSGSSPPPSTQQNLPFPQSGASYSRQQMPIQAPPPPQQTYHTQQVRPQQPQRPTYAPQHATSMPPRPLTGEQMAKILSEADIVETNVQVLSDLMLNSIPGQERQNDIDFIQTLKDTIQKMQTRLMELLNSPNTEEITGRLLQLNDDINNVFTRHERYLRQTQAASNPESTQRPIHIPEDPTADTGISYPTLSTSTPDPQLDSSTPDFSSPATKPPVPAVTAPAVATPAVSPPAVTTPAVSDPIAELLLLDFGTTSSGVDATPVIPIASPQVAAAQPPAQNTELDEFDIFAKSRQNTYGTEFTNTSYSDTATQPSTSITKALHPRSMSPEDAHGISEWLAATNLTTTDAKPDSQTTSEDFDKFLEERVNAPYTKSAGSSKAKKSKEKVATPDDMFSL